MYGPHVTVCTPDNVWATKWNKILQIMRGFTFRKLRTWQRPGFRPGINICPERSDHNWSARGSGLNAPNVSSRRPGGPQMCDHKSVLGHIWRTTYSAVLWGAAQLRFHTLIWHCSKIYIDQLIMISIFFFLMGKVLILPALSLWRVIIQYVYSDWVKK